MLLQTSVSVGLGYGFVLIAQTRTEIAPVRTPSSQPSALNPQLAPLGSTRLRRVPFGVSPKALRRARYRQFPRTAFACVGCKRAFAHQRWRLGSSSARSISSQHALAKELGSEYVQSPEPSLPVNVQSTGLIQQIMFSLNEIRAG